MASLAIEGGAALRGTVKAGGAKNAALPIMAASILADGPLRLLGVPRVADVRTLGRLLRRLGLEVLRQGEAIHLRTVDAAEVRAPDALVRQMRASFCVLGPLLARRGRAVVPLPGGCRIGDRPVDLHLRGLAALGAQIELRGGCVIARADRLVGTTVDLHGPCGPTVTGTANILSAAVLAKGETILRGAAREPEIVDLADCLNMLGAQIEGQGTPTIRVRGVPRLGGGAWRIIPDRIEAATLLLAAAITRGCVEVQAVRTDHLASVLELLRAAGCAMEYGESSVRIDAARRLKAVDLLAKPYPGVPTDVQSQWTALMALARGTSRISDSVFPGRFLHLAELRRMGADVRLVSGAAVAHGRPRLSGAKVAGCDLRATAALVLTALAAEGRTVVSGREHLERGYERLDAKLRRLGASIAVEPADEVLAAPPSPGLPRAKR